MKKKIFATTLITATVIAGSALYTLQDNSTTTPQNSEVVAQTFEGTLEDALINNVQDVTNEQKTTQEVTEVALPQDAQVAEPAQNQTQEPTPVTTEQPAEQTPVEQNPVAEQPTTPVVVVSYYLTQVDENNWNCTYTYSDGSTYTFLHKTIFPNYTRRIGVCSNLALGTEKIN